MASGDTTKALAAKVRTLLDEASAAFWSDAEIYASLNDGQREVINILLSIYKAKAQLNPDEPLPQGLRNLMSITTTATGTQNLPTGFLYPLAIYLSSGGTVYIRPDGQGRGAARANTYLASSTSQPYCTINSSQVVFETSVSWTMEYLAQPANDMDASHDPFLNYSAYNAIVEYSTAFLLNKDENPRAGQHFQKFMQEVQNLIF